MARSGPFLELSAEKAVDLCVAMIINTGTTAEQTRSEQAESGTSGKVGVFFGSQPLFECDMPIGLIIILA